MIMHFIDKAVDSGARLKKAAATMGLSARTIIRWRQQNGGRDQRNGPLAAPANKLSDEQRQQVSLNVRKTTAGILSATMCRPTIGITFFQPILD